jgi:hypothetical protein
MTERERDDGVGDDRVKAGGRSKCNSKAKADNGAWANDAASGMQKGHVATGWVLGLNRNQHALKASRRGV